MNARLKSLAVMGVVATVFGFAGASAAVFAFGDRLEGPRGRVGAAGPAGPAGPVGPSDMGARNALLAMTNEIEDLKSQVTDLDSKVSASTAAQRQCWLGSVVTDVQTRFGGEVTALKSPLVCLPFP